MPGPKWASLYSSAFAAAVLAACVGTASESAPADPPQSGSGWGGKTPKPGVDSLTTSDGLGLIGLRRLSRDELRATVQDVTRVDLSPFLTVFPNDPETPFDVDTLRSDSERPTALVLGLESIANSVATEVLANAERKAALLGCAPKDADDTACMNAFIQRAGRRMLRRPLDAQEVAQFAAAVEGLKAEVVAAKAPWTFDQGASLVLRALMLDPEFIFRVEIGSPAGGNLGLRRLNGFELASRLSFLLWGSGPDDALLDAAAAGKLDKKEDARALVDSMLADPRATRQLNRFHAMWLGYKEMPFSEALSAGFRREADALVERVVLKERRPWMDLLTSEETFIDAAQATHYGLPAPAGGTGPQWVSYGSSPRRGILSQAAFLSAAAKFADTSPTQRGLHVRARLLCQVIPTPDPAAQSQVATDLPPEGDACKKERYAVHAKGACAGCHALTDPIGFGLEQYDTQGRFREHDEGRADCPLDGKGEVAGEGAFTGPGELGRVLANSGTVRQCVTTQVFRFAIGRTDAAEDGAMLSTLPRHFQSEGYRLDALLKTIATSDAFRYRLAEVP